MVSWYKGRGGQSAGARSAVRFTDVKQGAHKKSASTASRRSRGQPTDLKTTVCFSMMTKHGSAWVKRLHHILEVDHRRALVPMDDFGKPSNVCKAVEPNDENGNFPV